MSPKTWTPHTVFDLLKHRWPENFYDLYPGYSKAASATHECFYESKQQAYEIANEIIAKFNSMPERIKLYRVIAVKSESDIDLGNPGESWSYQKTSAISFGRRELPERSVKVLLTATIMADDVDWLESLKKDLVYSQGEYAEDEIYVSPRTPLYDLTWVKL